MSPWKPKDFSKMLKNIKISTPKNIEIYILFWGTGHLQCCTFFLETEHFLREFHKKIAGISTIYTILLEFTQKTTTQILNPKKIEIYPCQKQKLEQLFFLFLLFFV